MEQSTASKLARRESPYGLAILPEKDQYDYTDPQNETAVQHRWQRLCEQHGAAILGIRDVPTSPMYVRLDGVVWELGPLGTTERAVPAEVFNRWRALEAAGVPFYYWLWGEEQPQRPNFRPMSVTATPRPDSSSDWFTQRRDPIVIGVIPTAPQRGLWVLLGRWFH